MKKTLADVHPNLVKEWDYTKNGELTPHDVPPVGRQIIWWICEKGHSYPAKIAHKSYGKACPDCKIFDRSIFVRKPEVLKFWDYKRNIETPDRISYGSKKNYWWTCEVGHSFDNPVTEMTRKGRGGCPYCRGLRVDDSNSLASLFPDLAKEWVTCLDDPDLTPKTITPGSTKRVLWRCAKRHEWDTSPKHRTSGKTGCRFCKSGRRISKQAYTLFYYLKQEFPDTVLEFPLEGSRMSLDLYIPSQNVAIEYDGGLFHKEKERDIKKEKLLLEKMPETSLVRIREPDCENYFSPNSKVIKYHLDNQKPEIFQQCIERVFLDVFNINKKINLEEDNIDILKLMNLLEEENSLGKLYPYLAKEWDTEENKGLTPYQFKAASHEKVFWKCKKGHSWEAKIASRSHGGNNCPSCGSRKISPENNLAVKYPSVIKEWHPTRNKKKPADYFPHSHHSVWWLCSQCKHEWEAFIYNRTLGKSGCPNRHKKRKPDTSG